VRDFRLVVGVVRAHDTALGIAALVLGGVLDRHPRLRLIAATGGGSLALLRRRLDLLQGRPPGGPPGGAGAGPPALPRPPSSYLDQVYVDTCVYDPFALEVVVRAFGAQRVLFGTDWPPVEIPAAQLIDQVRSLPVTVAERTAIMGGNASRLLSLEASTAAG
jgi:aminocarboxymuconate-semialdehyde decarboxylase